MDFQSDAEFPCINFALCHWRLSNENLCLEVKALVGSHTAEFIKKKLMTSMNSFYLETEKLAMLLRDNASNGVKACEDMNVMSFGHGLHLVVGPFVLEKKTRKESDVNSEDEAPGIAAADDDEDDSDIVEYQDLEEEKNPEIVVAEREIVSKFRTVAKYFNKSPKAKEKLLQFGSGGSSSDTTRDIITIVSDVRIRWIPHWTC